MAAAISHLESQQGLAPAHNGHDVNGMHTNPFIPLTDASPTKQMSQNYHLRLTYGLKPLARTRNWTLSAVPLLITRA
jgi:hypothetical protein